MLSFKIEKQDKKSYARCGQIILPQGSVETPVFMPVGTNATIKGLLPEQIESTQSKLILANTYHLYLAPGMNIIEKFEGVKKFMGWDGLMLTDSGGFQVFSLPKKKIEEEGVTFSHPLTGEKILFTPELSIDCQEKIGADIIMSFDECLPFPVDYAYAKESIARTTRWALRGKKALKNHKQALFGIIQGSNYADLRKQSANEIVDLDFEGYSIGGVSVGEGHDIMMETLNMTMPYLPTNKPRYLMGVGMPQDIIGAVERGVDMFDCVIPSRFARSASLFTRKGRIRLTNKKYRRDKYPIDTQCQCYTCQKFTRAYVHHLYKANEILAATLGAIHNLTFFQDFMRDIRFNIMQGTLKNFKMQFFSNYITEKEDQEG
jgi:queuine tRNA-ribosyltransferase